MPTNKQAILRYRKLDQCFRNTGKRYFIEDLVEECSFVVDEYSRLHSEKKTGISKRQVQEDIKFMESMDGYNVELERFRDGKRIFFRYKNPSFSISNQPLNEYEANQLKESLLTLSRFQGLPQFEWVNEMIARLQSSFQLTASESPVIEFDQNPYLKGLEYISPIYYAISEKRAVKVTYKGVRATEAVSYEFSPHYLKQYNSRWFVFGLVQGRYDVTNLALDRIQILDESGSEFQDSRIDYQEYFEDVVGVTVNEETVEEVILEVTDSLLPYIKSKPLHGSQKVLEEGSVHKVNISVQLNYELEALILSYGEGLKVLSPNSLKQSLKTRILKMLE